MQQLASCVVEGQHAQIGWGLLLPYCFLVVQKYLQQQTANTAGSVALAAAGRERCLQVCAVCSPAEQVFEAFAGFAALRQLLRREQTQTVFQQLPQKLGVVASGSKRCVRIVGDCLQPTFVTGRYCTADSAGAGYTATDSGGVVALIRALQIKRSDACGNLLQCFGVFQCQDVVGSAEGCVRS